MTDPAPAFALQKLAALRTELIDLAFELERQRRLDAADVAISTAGRLEEIGAQLAAEARPLPAGPD